MNLEELFARYQRWYREIYLQELLDELMGGDPEGMEEFAEDGWVEPLGSLHRLGPVQLTQAQKTHGDFPAAYCDLLAQVGTGTLLCANEEEPTEHEFLHPDAIDMERQALMSWLSPEGLKRIRDDQGIDVSKVIPFLKPDGTCWVVLSNQREGDDRTFVFDHGFEGSYDRLLCGPESLETFLENYLRRAMFKNPLNGFNCWEAPQAE